MKIVKTKKKKCRIFLKLFTLFVGGSVVFSLVGLQMSINSKRKEMEKLKEELRVQEIKNNELRDAMKSESSNNDDYVKKIARKRLDFAENSERVFVAS